jgi:hypothetical protein
VWRTPVEDWHNGYGITNAPLYYDGIVYTGITGSEFAVRGRLTALDAETGKILWRACTPPTPCEPGGDTWPVGSDHYSRGGASIWNTLALGLQLGLVDFAVANCGPDYDGSMREGDNFVSRFDPRGECQDRCLCLAYSRRCTTTSGRL